MLRERNMSWCVFSSYLYLCHSLMQYIYSTTSFVFKLWFDHFFPPQTFPSGNSSMLFIGAHVGGVSHATLPPCSSVLVCPCLACPPLHLPSMVSFLRASPSEPKQQFHLFCQSWECTQPSLVVFLPAQLGAKPVDFTHMPALPFLFHSFTLSVWVCDSANV